MSSPLDQSIVDLLRQSALAAVVDRPVDAVLRDMGLPALPQLPPAPPLPELPPLPVLDLTALTKPITDLAGSFGTGTFGAGSGVNPAEMLSQVMTVLQTATQLGSTVLQAVMSDWQGAGATATASRAAVTAADSAAVTGQGARMSAGTTRAAGSVFVGNVQMTGLTAKFLASVAAAAPFLGTPPGQAFLATMTAETLAEALAVVAKTRAELAAHSAEMTQSGEKVPVTDAPTGVHGVAARGLAPVPGAQQVAAGGGPQGLDPTRFVTQALQLVQALAPVSSIGAQAIASIAGVGPVESSVAAPVVARGVPTPVFAPVAAVSGPATTAAPTATPLQEARTATVLPGGVTASPTAAVIPAATTAASPGMMPMAPLAGAAGRPPDVDASGPRSDLVTAQHGNEVVGPLHGVSVPVVGAPDVVTAQAGDDPECPDKALTL